MQLKNTEIFRADLFLSPEGQIELHINFVQFLSGMVFKLMCFSEKLSQQAI
jgi:hypothetical protein